MQKRKYVSIQIAQLKGSMLRIGLFNMNGLK